MLPSIALLMVATAFVVCAFGSSRSHTTRFLFVEICEKIGLYVPPIPITQTTEAVATIDNAKLGRVRQELDYRLDVCSVTNVAHIEHF